MKIAVPSMDGISISPHFGQSVCYLVYHLRGAEIVGKEVRMLTEHRAAPRSPANPSGRISEQVGILTPLLDCEVVLSGGMGSRMAVELEGRGVRPLVVADPALSPDETVERFLTGNLALARMGPLGVKTAGVVDDEIADKE